MTVPGSKLSDLQKHIDKMSDVLWRRRTLNRSGADGGPCQARIRKRDEDRGDNYTRVPLEYGFPPSQTSIRNEMGSRKADTLRVTMAYSLASIEDVEMQPQHHSIHTGSFRQSCHTT